MTQQEEEEQIKLDSSKQTEDLLSGLNNKSPSPYDFDENIREITKKAKQQFETTSFKKNSETSEIIEDNSSRKETPEAPENIKEAPQIPYFVTPLPPLRGEAINIKLEKNNTLNINKGKISNIKTERLDIGKRDIKLDPETLKLSSHDREEKLDTYNNNTNIKKEPIFNMHDLKLKKIYDTKNILTSMHDFINVKQENKKNSLNSNDNSNQFLNNLNIDAPHVEAFNLSSLLVKKELIKEVSKEKKKEKYNIYEHEYKKIYGKPMHEIKKETGFFNTNNQTILPWQIPTQPQPIQQPINNQDQQKQSMEISIKRRKRTKE